MQTCKKAASDAYPQSSVSVNDTHKVMVILLAMMRPHCWPVTRPLAAWVQSRWQTVMT